jgi:hypothetical protein
VSKALLEVGAGPAVERLSRQSKNVVNDYRCLTCVFTGCGSRFQPEFLLTLIFLRALATLAMDERSRRADGDPRLGDPHHTVSLKFERVPNHSDFQLSMNE